MDWELAMDWELSGKMRRRLRERMQSTDDARECRRCHALLRVDAVESVSAVVQEFGVARQSLYNWREKLEVVPIERLKDQPRSGRPTGWTDERVDTLEQLLADSPRRHGFHAVGWTAGLLQTRLEQLLAWNVSEDTLRRKLHQLDYVWKRYRYILKPDPLREKKRRIRKIENERVISFETEICEAMEMCGLVIVCLEPQREQIDPDNVYAFQKSGEFAWRIEHIHEAPPHQTNTYTGLGLWQGLPEGDWKSLPAYREIRPIPAGVSEGTIGPAFNFSGFATLFDARTGETYGTYYTK